MSASKFPLLDRRGGCAIKKKAAFLAGADGVVDQATADSLDLPPRRSRSKTIARVFPSCPGGEICSPIHFPYDYLDRLFMRLNEIAEAAWAYAPRDWS